MFSARALLFGQPYSPTNVPDPLLRDVFDNDRPLPCAAFHRPGLHSFNPGALPGASRNGSVGCSGFNAA